MRLKKKKVYVPEKAYNPQKGSRNERKTLEVCLNFFSDRKKKKYKKSYGPLFGNSCVEERRKKVKKHVHSFCF